MQDKEKLEILNKIEYNTNTTNFLLLEIKNLLQKLLTIFEECSIHKE